MNRKPMNKRDFTPITVKNVITGDVYLTCKAFDKKHIDGVEFTQVSHKDRLMLVRTDSLKKVAEKA